MSVARELGVRYIWIDALCIIQDNEDDWERESAKMALVYSNSCLNIAAAFGHDNTTGLALELAPQSRCFRIYANHTDELSTVPDAYSQYVHQFYFRLRPRADLDFDQFPLFKRAWVQQEMILSPRTLYFCGDQLIWKCRRQWLSEDHSTCMPFDKDEHQILDSTLRRVMGQKAGLYTNEQSVLTWQSWIEDYKRRYLTYETDRLPALAGISAYFTSKTGASSLAGLVWWRKEPDLLLKQLAWYATEDGNPANAARRSGRVPTWSWASVDGTIRFTREPLLHPLRPQVQVLDAQVLWRGSDFVSEIQEAYIEVRGDMAPWPPVFTEIPDEVHWDFCDSIDAKPQPMNYEILGLEFLHLFDVAANDDDDKSPKPDSNHVALILQRHGRDHSAGLDTYRRIGLCIQSSRGWTDEHALDDPGDLYTYHPIFPGRKERKHIRLI
ncbi:MAG: hypothetical protein MMC23_001610 [Stictis urceolatum]|nr:hypothetical protein [Stictis urceolata]